MTEIKSAALELGTERIRKLLVQYAVPAIIAMTASQESITKLEGLYTAMLVHETNIDTNVENVAGSMQTALGHLKRIDTNTGECSETLKLMRKDMRDMKDDLTTLRRDGIKTR